MRYICTNCAYVYDESWGDPESNVPAGTKFEDLPEDWTCPMCLVSKDYFRPLDD